jgi:hypothetical protein
MNSSNLSRAERKILDEAAKNGGRISARKYREIYAKNRGSHKKKSGGESYFFKFEMEVVQPGKTYRVALIGRHLSTNSYNSLSLKNQMRYKSAIKDAAYLYFLDKGKAVIPDAPFQKIEIFPVAHNPVSRDDDGNNATLKILRDILETYAFVVSDKRKHVTQHKCEEILAREWKIEMLLHVTA